MRMLALGAVAACLLTTSFAGEASAQRWGRGGWNGNRWGGYYGNSYGWGVTPYRYGWSGYSYPNSGYSYYQPYYYNNWANSPGLSYYYSSPGYAYSTPNYYSSGYYTTPNYSSSGTIVPNYYNSIPSESGAVSSSMYQDPTANNRVYLRVILPDPSARLTIQGQATSMTGTERVFYSPPMDPNGNYTYTLKATWVQNGQEVSREKTVDVRTGQNIVVRFDDVSPVPLNPGVANPVR